MPYSESLAERIRKVIVDERGSRSRSAIGASHRAGGSNTSAKSRGKTAALNIAPGITEKKMFGGVGFLLNGNMLVGVWKDSLVVRLEPDEWSDALKEPNVTEFDITGRSMKGWVLVEPDGLERDEELKRWLGRAIAYVGTLPAK